MKKLPHKHIGSITFTSTKTHALGKGTGILISANLVLTCAHNIYDKINSQLFRDHKFYPGLNGILEDGYEIEDIFIPMKYHTMYSPPLYDYALLKLRKRIESDEFLELDGNYEELERNHTNLAIYGYPSNKYGNDEDGYLTASQYGLNQAGKILELRLNRG